MVPRARTTALAALLLLAGVGACYSLAQRIDWEWNRRVDCAHILALHAGRSVCVVPLTCKVVSANVTGCSRKCGTTITFSPDTGNLCVPTRCDFLHPNAEPRCTTDCSLDFSTIFTAEDFDPRECPAPPGGVADGGTADGGAPDAGVQAGADGGSQPDGG